MGSVPGRRRKGDPHVRPRHLLILVASLPIEDGQTPPPVVGEIGQFLLSFVEARGNEPDATVSIIRARAEPLGDGSPRGPGKRWDGTPRERPPVWPTVLHGDGWSATWSAPRPVIGQVRLRGTLTCDLMVGVRTGVRGLITRARVVTETIDTTDPDHSKWRPIPSEQRLREVAVGPRWFDHGLVPPPHAPASGWYAPVPADPYMREVGVLVDLDVDNVPPLPLRPSIVPGAISVANSDLWVADVCLPLMVRVRGPLTDRLEVTEFWWAGQILDTEHSRGRRLHADPAGCWVIGPDGVHRADADGSVRKVSDQSGWLAAAHHGLLLIQVHLEPGNPHGPVAVRLITPAGPVTDVELIDRAIEAAVPTGDEPGFVLLLRRHDQSGHPASGDRGGPADPRPWLGRLNPDGRLTEGPYLDIGRGVYPRLIAADPPLVNDGDTAGRARLRRVRDDLTLDDGVPMLPVFLGAWTAAGRVWIANHPPHPHDIARHGAQASLALPDPPEYPEDRPYWLLTELDPDTLDPITSTLVQRLPGHLAVDDTGTVWVQADGVRHLPPVDGAAAELLDVARLLDHNRQAEAMNAEPYRPHRT